MVGIFIGVQLDRLYEVQREKSNEGDHIAALIEDFALNRSALNAAISASSESIEAVLTLRDEGRKPPTSLSPEELNRLFAQVARLPTFEVVRRAYDNLTNSGGLTQLSDAELRRDLTEFYAKMGLAELVQNTQELQFVTLLQPYVIEHLDYAATTRFRLYDLDEASRLDPPTDPELILEVLSTIEFQNLMVAEWETASDLLAIFDDLLEYVERIENMLPAVDGN